MYKSIMNPQTGMVYPTNSKLGRQTIELYAIQLGGSSSLASHRSTLHVPLGQSDSESSEFTTADSTDADSTDAESTDAGVKTETENSVIFFKHMKELLTDLALELPKILKYNCTNKNKKPLDFSKFSKIDMDEYDKFKQQLEAEKAHHEEESPVEKKPVSSSESKATPDKYYKSLEMPYKYEYSNSREYITTIDKRFDDICIIMDNSLPADSKYLSADMRENIRSLRDSQIDGVNKYSNIMNILDKYKVSYPQNWLFDNDHNLKETRSIKAIMYEKLYEYNYKLHIGDIVIANIGSDVVDELNNKQTAVIGEMGVVFTPHEALVRLAQSETHDGDMIGVVQNISGGTIEVKWRDPGLQAKCRRAQIRKRSLGIEFYYLLLRIWEFVPPVPPGDSKPIIDYTIIGRAYLRYIIPSAEQELRHLRDNVKYSHEWFWDTSLLDSRYNSIDDHIIYNNIVKKINVVRECVIKEMETTWCGLQKEIYPFEVYSIIPNIDKLTSAREKWEDRVWGDISDHTVLPTPNWGVRMWNTAKYIANRLANSTAPPPPAGISEEMAKYKYKDARRIDKTTRAFEIQVGTIVNHPILGRGVVVMDNPSAMQLAKVLDNVYALSLLKREEEGGKKVGEEGGDGDAVQKYVKFLKKLSKVSVEGLEFEEKKQNNWVYIVISNKGRNLPVRTFKYPCATNSSDNATKYLKVGAGEVLVKFDEEIVKFDGTLEGRGLLHCDIIWEPASGDWKNAMAMIPETLNISIERPSMDEISFTDEPFNAWDHWCSEWVDMVAEMFWWVTHVANPTTNFRENFEFIDRRSDYTKMIYTGFEKTITDVSILLIRLRYINKCLRVYSAQPVGGEDVGGERDCGGSRTVVSSNDDSGIRRRGRSAWFTLMRRANDAMVSFTGQTKRVAKQYIAKVAKKKQLDIIEMLLEAGMDAGMTRYTDSIDVQYSIIDDANAPLRDAGGGSYKNKLLCSSFVPGDLNAIINQYELFSDRVLLQPVSKLAYNLNNSREFSDQGSYPVDVRKDIYTDLLKTLVRDVRGNIIEATPATPADVSKIPFTAEQLFTLV